MLGTRGVRAVRPPGGTSSMQMPSMLLAYIGPDTLLPMTSVVATVVGVLLMFGRNSVRYSALLVTKCYRRVVRK